MQNVNPLSIFIFEMNFFNNKKKNPIGTKLAIYNIFSKDLRHFTTLAPKGFPFDTIG
jgi:hypothetical protein